MFTLLRNYRAMIHLLMVNPLNEKLTPAVDVDKDGDLDMVDINKFDADTQAAIRRVLGDTNMQTLEKGSRFAISDLIENGFIVERDTAKSESTQQRETHRSNVESSTEILPIERDTFQRLLERGSRGEDVRALQDFLLREGFNPNGVDGSFGPGTERALLNYQNANGLPRSGKLLAGTTASRQSSETLNHILGVSNSSSESSARQNTDTVSRGVDSNESAPSFSRTLRRGMRGVDVQALQIILTNKGYDTNGTEGTFGPGTERALKNYQREVLGQGGDGVMDLNGATMRSLVNGASTDSIESATADRTRARGREAMNSRDLRDVNKYVEGLDKILDSSALQNSRIRSLVQDISQMSTTGRLDDNVWNSFIETARAVGWEDFVSGVEAEDFTDAQKFDFLTRGFEENTMGGTRMTEQLREGNSIASISTFEQNNRDLNKMAQILSGETGIPVINIINARQSWLNQAGSSSFSSRNFTEGEIWSTRSQGITDITGIRSFRSHQIISLPGRKDYVDMNLQVPELINNMSEYSLNDIKDGLGSVSNQITTDEIRQALLTGEPIVKGKTTIKLTYDIGFFKSADCFNDAVGIIPKVQTETERREREDDSSSQVTSQPKGDASVVSSTPKGGGTPTPASDLSASAGGFTPPTPTPASEKGFQPDE